MKSSYSIVLKTDFKLAVTNVNHSLKNEGFTIIDSIEYNELEEEVLNDAPICCRILCDYNPYYKNELQEYNQKERFVPQHYNVKIEEIERNHIEVSFVNPEITYNTAMFKRHDKLISKALNSLLTAINNMAKTNY